VGHGSSKYRYRKFWIEFSTYRITARRYPSVMPRLSDCWARIRKLAEQLCLETGDKTLSRLREFIERVCEAPQNRYWSLVRYEYRGPAYSSRRFRVDEDAEPARDRLEFLQAAILNNCSAVVENILQCSDTPVDLVDQPTTPRHDIEIFRLAGRRGCKDIVEALLSSANRLGEPEYGIHRKECMFGAIASGDLRLVAVVTDPRWGPMNFVDGEDSPEIASCLSIGMVRSDEDDYHIGLYSLLESRLQLGQHTIKFKPPDINALLGRIASHSRQRSSLIEYLLDNSATLQDKGLPQQYPMAKLRNRYTSLLAPTPGPWNPLREAVQAGSRKVVELLLKRGADPNAVDDDVLWLATLSGRLDIVRLLVESGADTNRLPWGRVCRRESRKKPDPKSPLWNAVRLEHKEMCLYLLENGAGPSLSIEGPSYLKAVKAEGMDSMVTFLLGLGVQTADVLPPISWKSGVFERWTSGLREEADF
jgi:hypothetical protein